MSRSLILLLFTLVFSTAIFAQPGRLDEDILKYSGKLRQFPRNVKYVEALKPLLEQADHRDHTMIESLKASGQPDVWYDMYLAMSRISDRQKLVSSLPEPARTRLAYPGEDLDKELELARHKAAAFLHARAGKLLQQPEPAAAREAFRDLELLAAIDSGHFEISPMIYRSILNGAGKITFELSNETGKTLTRGIISGLDDIVTVVKAHQSGISTKGNLPEGPFEFLLKVRLTEISIGPEQSKNFTYREVRDILDEQGLKKDSILCDVKETRQAKSASLEGYLEFTDARNGHTVIRTPVKATSFFSHRYASLQGDPDACSEETRALIKQHKAAFPSGEAILLDAVKKFSKAAIGILTGQEPSE